MNLENPIRSSRSSRRAVASLVMVAVALAVVPTAGADGLHEPNDSPAAASGPIAGGVDYSGGIDTPQDLDYFAINLAGSRQVNVAVRMDGCSKKTGNPTGGQSISARLLDGNMRTVASTAVGKFETVGTRTLSYTVPATGRYYVRFANNINGTVADTCGYSFRVDPADAVLPSLPAPVPAPAPSPTPAPPAPDTAGPVISNPTLSTVRSSGGTPSAFRFRATISEVFTSHIRFAANGVVFRSLRSTRAFDPKRYQWTAAAPASYRSAYRKARRRRLPAPKLDVHVALRDPSGNVTNQSYRVAIR